MAKTWNRNGAKNVGSWIFRYRNWQEQKNGQKHQLNNLYFKYQVCEMKLRHLNTFLQFRLLFHEPHCMLQMNGFSPVCVLSCVFKFPRNANLFSHTLQPNGNSPWWVSSCCLSLSERANVSSHKSHLWGLVSMCKSLCFLMESLV